MAGDRVVEIDLREKCCSVVVKLFSSKEVLIYTHALGLKKLVRSELKESGLGNIEILKTEKGDIIYIFLLINILYILYIINFSM